MAKKFGSINKVKVAEFLDKKGFYLVLFICIGIITLTAYVVTKRNLSSYMDISEIDNMPRIQKEEPKKEALVPTQNLKPETITKNEIPKSNSKSNKIVNDTETKVITPVTSIKMDWPINGIIKKPFADNSLIYSETLGEWGTHEGVDISGDRGLPVKAGLDGVVSDIYTDPGYGITIVISSDNNIKVKYSNLSSDNMVKKGDAIKKGDVISGIGNTALFESSESSHLHLEVLQNGENVDPKILLNN